MNYKFCYIISLIVLAQFVKSVTVLTKNDVLNLNLKQFNQNSTCPEYSGGKIEYFEYQCSYTFYCIDDKNCQPDLNFTSPYFEFTGKDGSVKKYIKETCQKKDVQDNDCITEKCTADSDCISNKCFQGSCIQGNSLFTECSDNNDDSDIDNQFQVMKCGRPHGQKCSRDGHCAGRCLDDICNHHIKLTPTNPIHVDYFIYILIGIAVITIVGVILLYCCANKISKIIKNCINK